MSGWLAHLCAYVMHKILDEILCCSYYYYLHPHRLLFLLVLKGYIHIHLDRLHSWRMKKKLLRDVQLNNVSIAQECGLYCIVFTL